MEDFKNCMLEFLKKEILCKQEMEKIVNLHREDLENFENQRQEDLEKYWKELEQQEKRFSKLLETFSEKENDPGSSNIFFSGFHNQLDWWIHIQTRWRSHIRSILSGGYEEILLPGKFGAVEHKMYANFLLPRHPGEI